MSSQKNITAISTVVYDPIFKQEIRVFCNTTEDAWMRWQRRRKIVNAEGLDPNHVAFSTHVAAEGEPNVYIIWLNHFSWTLDDQESLIHEITHTVVRIWEADNIKFVPETQEFFAHSVGRIYALIGAKLLSGNTKSKEKEIES
jgi:hypothetical protein